MMADFNVWANRRVREALGACSPEQLGRPLGGSFPSLRDALVHLHGAEWLWFRRLQGESPDAFPAPDGFPSPAHLDAAWTALDDACGRWAASLDDGEAGRPCTYRDTRGWVHRQPVWQIVWGQVTTLLRRPGLVPAATDLVLGLRERQRDPRHRARRPHSRRPLQGRHPRVENGLGGAAGRQDPGMKACPLRGRARRGCWPTSGPYTLPTP